MKDEQRLDQTPVHPFARFSRAARLPVSLAGDSTLRQRRQPVDPVTCQQCG